MHYAPRHYYGLGATQVELREQARQLYAQGQAAHAAGRYQDALEAFQAAYRTYTRPEVLVAIAESLEKLGRTSEAIEKLRDYLRRDPSGPLAENARARLDRLLPPETPVAPSVPPSVREGAPAAPPPGGAPPMPEAYARGSTVGIWVATGVGIAALVGLGFWLSRPKKPKANRRRRRRRR